MRFSPSGILLSFAALSHAFNYDLRIGAGGRNLNDFRNLARDLEAIEAGEDVAEGHGYGPVQGSPYGYPNQYIQMPIDHFQNESQYEPHSNGTFSNRYWFTDRFYKPGGPVILLLVGEASGTLRLPILHTGIAHQFIQENNGLGVVMEHRYYGRSFPTPNLSTKNLRFLTTQQALADVAYLAQNVQFKGLEKYGDLTSKTTPWIVYGGSYSGAMSAFLRVQYPDVFWGAISSSGVTKAIYDYWQYFSPIVEYAPASCIAAQKLFVNMVDTIYNKGNATLNARLQSTFNLPNVTYFPDFVNQLSSGITDWQSLEWDPAINYDGFYWYCGNISSTEDLFHSTKTKHSMAVEMLVAGGYSPNATIVNQLLNYIGWNTETYVTPCAESGQTQNECFTTVNQTYYSQDGLDQYNWRSWSYQYCTQWGFLQTGSGVPSDQMPIVSRLIDLNYTGTVCRDAFGIDGPPDVELSNQYGGYNIAYDRLALIGGEWDPWRPATPLAFSQGATQRQSTTDQPFILIPDAVHHWDEYGVKEKYVTKTFPPQSIQQVQAQEHAFVKAWLQEWKSQNSTSRK